MMISIRNAFLWISPCELFGGGALYILGLLSPLSQLDFDGFMRFN